MTWIVDAYLTGFVLMYALFLAKRDNYERTRGFWVAVVLASLLWPLTLVAIVVVRIDAEWRR